MTLLLIFAACFAAVVTASHQADGPGWVSEGGGEVGGLLGGGILGALDQSAGGATVLYCYNFVSLFCVWHKYPRHAC